LRRIISTRNHPLLILIFSVSTLSSLFAIDISVNAKDVIKENKEGVASANLCWLTDSDKHWKRPISTSEAIKDLGIGSARFPYGHLADYYFWHWGSYKSLKKNQLKPKMLGMPSWLKKWEWAFNDNGTIKNAMDFDEYIDMCKKGKIKPLVTVNVLSWKLPGGPSREETIKSAAEWVRYASKKDYQVEYWAIGNEVDHKSPMPMKEYFELYTDIVKAMKRVNPNIKTGPGILGKDSYYNAALQLDPKLIDFSCVHQYMFFYGSKKAAEGWKVNAFKAWQKTSSTEGYGNLAKAQKFYKKANREDLELVVTETGITGNPKNSGRENNLWKALWWFEVLMYEIKMPGVSYSYYWGTHSPWSGGTEKAMKGKDQGVLLRLDNNKKKPTGDIVRIVNKTVYKQILEVERVHGDIRAFASRDKETGKLSILLLNKGDQILTVNLNLKGNKNVDWVHCVYSGKSPTDILPKITQAGKYKNSKKLKVNCPPLSLSILRQ
jgi:alpha-L-arabinofuranosidase